VKVTITQSITNHDYAQVCISMYSLIIGTHVQRAKTFIFPDLQKCGYLTFEIVRSKLYRTTGRKGGINQLLPISCTHSQSSTAVLYELNL